MVTSGTNPLSAPFDVLIVRGGVSTAGASLAAAATLALRSRRRLVATADGLAAAALVGLAGWHAGCLFRSGSCLGSPTDLPWGIPLEGSTVPRHPVELYAAILLLAAGMGVSWWRARGSPAPGAPAAVAVVVAAAVRLVTEPFRPSLDGGPVAFYLTAAAAGFVGLAVATVRPRLSRRGSGDDRERP